MQQNSNMPLENLWVLTYNGCSLYVNDLLLLDGPFWLNDKLMGFYMDYLEREVYNNLSVCFIKPEITQCLKLSPDVDQFLDPLNFRCKDYAVMILNDWDDPVSAGGTHWSLLVFCQQEHTFYHLDSLFGYNRSCAKALSTKIAKYVGGNYNYKFQGSTTLEQKNNYDCGVYTLCHLENVLYHIAVEGKLSKIEQISMEQVSRKRMELKNLIIEMLYDDSDNESGDSSEEIEEEDESEVSENIKADKHMNGLCDNYLEQRKINNLSNAQCNEAEKMKECENEVKNSVKMASRKRSLMLSEKEKRSCSQVTSSDTSYSYEQKLKENASDKCEVGERKLRRTNNKKPRRSMRIQEKMRHCAQRQCSM